MVHQSGIRSDVEWVEMQTDIKNQLTDLAGQRTIEYSDSWSDEDLSEATAAALRRFEDEERHELLNHAS